MRYFHETQSTYQRDIYFNRYRLCYEILFYRIFLSHGSGRNSPAYFSHLCSWLCNLCRNPDDSLPQCCQPSCSGQKKRSPPAIPDFSSRCPLSPAVLQFFLQKLAPFLAGSVLGDRRCEHLLIRFLTFFLSVLYIAVLPTCLGLKDTKIPSSSQLLGTNCTYFQCSRYLSVFKPHRRICIWIAVLGLIFGEKAFCPL